MKLQSMIMVTLTRLLVIKIVASLRSESSRSRQMPSSLVFLSGLSSLRSAGDRLKNAISEPLAKPDNINSAMVSTMAIATSGVMG